MSTARRTYDVVRSFVGQEWERLQGLTRSDALRELEESLDPASPHYKVDPLPKEVKPRDAKEHARHILGVADGASFDAIHKAFESLNKRCDASKFKEGSPEAGQAAEIQKRVHWAYALLTEGMDESERRFRSLEID